MKAITIFNVTGWEPSTIDKPDSGHSFTRVTIRKELIGAEIKGYMVGEGLFSGMNNPSAGAGYVVMDHFTGQLGERTGSFVVQHGGLMGPGVEPYTFGNIVPGSGQDQLEGITGTIEISKSKEGEHILSLDYTFITN